MKHFSNCILFNFSVFNFPMRIDFYPKLWLTFVFWGLNFIGLFVSRLNLILNLVGLSFGVYSRLNSFVVRAFFFKSRF